MRQAIVNGRLVTPSWVGMGGVLMEDGCISALLGPDERPPDCPTLDAEGGVIAPGFIDLHTHGGGGADFTDGDAAGFVRAARTHLRHGTTAMTPTTLACDPLRLEAVFSAYEAAREAPDMPEMLGMHMEGPYFSMEMRGAQNPRFIKPPDPKEYLAQLDRAPFIRRWSLAPELPGALPMALELRRRGVLASIAHSDATELQVAYAHDSGFTMMTHFYSCMSTIRREDGYRVPGVIEAGLEMDGFVVELIADGHHLPDSLIRLVHRVKGASRVCLVTDSMRAAGMGDGPSFLGDSDADFPVLVENGVAKLPDRSAFAGSVATADVLLRVALRAGIPLADAVRMLTLTPAECMGVDARIGSLTAGKQADIVVLDGDCRIREVYAKGRRVRREEQEI